MGVAKQVTLRESIQTKYMEEDDQSQEDFGFIVFVSCSPEVKHGMLPHVITLNSYNIERFGDFEDLSSKIRHISELDLTDNLLADWAEVAEILAGFNNLVFLNLSNNLLNQPMDDNNNPVKERLHDGPLPLKKLVLNGNNVSWSAVLALVVRMPALEEVSLLLLLLLKLMHLLLCLICCPCSYRSPPPLVPRSTCVQTTWRTPWPPVACTTPTSSRSTCPVTPSTTLLLCPPTWWPSAPGRNIVVNAQ